MKNLKKLRKEAKMSQQTLADMLSVTQQTIYKYENSLAEPSLSTLSKMAEIFHTSIDYIVDKPEAKYIIQNTEITPPELAHLEMYRQLDKASQKNIDEIILAINRKKK